MLERFRYIRCATSCAGEVIWAFKELASQLARNIIYTYKNNALCNMTVSVRCAGSPDSECEVSL